MSDNRSKSVIGVFALIFIMFMIFMMFAFFMLKGLMSSSEKGASLLDDSYSPIAVVTVEGVILDSKKTVEELIEAEEDDSVKAIIVRINSPGGVVGPTQEIYEEIVRIDKIKPVYASFGSVAASGGYYIGAATRKIYSTAGVMTGSIGVIMQFMDLSKLYEWAKVSPETIKAGKYKDIGSPSRSMSEEERALMNDMVSGVHEQFIGAIEERRKDRIKGDIRQYAQGQIFTGTQALERGLVDEIAGLWEAGRRIFASLPANQTKGLKFSLRFIKTKKKFSFSDFLGDMEESVKDLSYYVKQSVLPMYLQR